MSHTKKILKPIVEHIQQEQQWNWGGKQDNRPIFSDAFVQSVCFLLHLIFFICTFLNRFPRLIPADSLPLASLPEAVSRGNGRLVYYDQRHPSHSSALGAGLAVSALQTLRRSNTSTVPRRIRPPPPPPAPPPTLAPPSPPPPAGLWNGSDHTLGSHYEPLC